VSPAQMRKQRARQSRPKGKIGIQYRHIWRHPTPSQLTYSDHHGIASHTT
jgi:hypothetical protein